MQGPLLDQHLRFAIMQMQGPTQQTHRMVMAAIHMSGLKMVLLRGLQLRLMPLATLQQVQTTTTELLLVVKQNKVPQLILPLLLT